jgi:hypothetical protein
MADAEAPVVAEAPKESEGPSPFEQKSPYYAKRIELFEKYFAREAEKQDAAKTTNETIKVVMPDGAIKEGVKHVTTPWDIAMGIHKKLAQASILAHVDGADWDMRRPLEGDCALKPLSPRGGSRARRTARVALCASHATSVTAGRDPDRRANRADAASDRRDGCVSVGFVRSVARADPPESGFASRARALSSNVTASTRVCLNSSD